MVRELFVVLLPFHMCLFSTTLLISKHVCIRIPSPVPLARLPCYMMGTRYNSPYGMSLTFKPPRHDDPPTLIYFRAIVCTSYPHALQIFASSFSPGPVRDRVALYCHWNAIATQPIGLVPFQARCILPKILLQYLLNWYDHTHRTHTPGRAG